MVRTPQKQAAGQAAVIFLVAQVEESISSPLAGLVDVGISAPTSTTLQTHLALNRLWRQQRSKASVRWLNGAQTRPKLDREIGMGPLKDG